MDKVSYESVRDTIKDGDLLFVHGNWTWKHPIQAIIMAATGSSLYHVGICFWMNTADTPRLMMVESHGGSNRRILNASFYDDHKVSVLPAPKPWSKEVCDVALAKVGKEDYGYMDAIYVGFRDFMLQHFSVHLPERHFDDEICSEFVANVYDLPQKAISPKDLWAMLTNTSDFQQQ